MTSTHQPKDFNQRVGKNVRDYRLARGRSQADLAAQLTVRGFPFQQQAILKVEKGTRPLKIEEVAVIADILGIGVAALLESGDEAARQTLETRLRLVHRLEVEIDELNKQVAFKTNALADARIRLQESRDELERIRTEGEASHG